MYSTLMRAGVIGDPIAHSRSPVMHNAAFAALGISAHYDRWHTPPAQLAERITSLRAQDILGANVTLPHKTAVVSLLDRVDTAATLIGAVNTITREADGTLSGINTDAPAFAASLTETHQFTITGCHAMVLGASGAARAAVVALLAGGAARVTVVNRGLARAQTLIGDLAAAGSGTLHAIAADDPQLAHVAASTTLIVNATSLGWQPHETPLAAQNIPPGVLIYDMVYRPTQLLADALARGARVADGADMLVRQAGLALERWTGRPAPLTVMRRAFVEAL